MPSLKEKISREELKKISEKYEEKNKKDPRGIGRMFVANLNYNALANAPASSGPSLAEEEPQKVAASGGMSQEEYIALNLAAHRLGYTVDEIDMALAKSESNGRDVTPEKWRLLRLRLDQEVQRDNDLQIKK